MDIKKEMAKCRVIGVVSQCEFREIWKEAQKERDELFLNLLKKEGCCDSRIKYWKKQLSNN